MENGSEQFDRLRHIVNLVISISGLSAVAILVVIVWQNRFDPVLTELVVKNFAAIIGLPFAFIASFSVVALFRQTEGAVEFEAMGLKFKGAAGQIVLWVLCFIAISGGIGFLWRD